MQITPAELYGVIHVLFFLHVKTVPAAPVVWRTKIT